MELAEKNISRAACLLFNLSTSELKPYFHKSHGLISRGVSCREREYGYVSYSFQIFFSTWLFGKS